MKPTTELLMNKCALTYAISLFIVAAISWDFWFSVIVSVAPVVITLYVNQDEVYSIWTDLVNFFGYRDPLNL